MIRLSQIELDTLRESLPEGGYKLVSEKLEGVSPETVRKVLTEPSRYKSHVIDATIELITEFKEKVKNQKAQIKKVVS